MIYTLGKADEELASLALLVHTATRDEAGEEHVLKNFSVEDTFIAPDGTHWYIAPFKNPDQPFTHQEVAQLVTYCNHFQITRLSFENKSGIEDAEVGLLAKIKNVSWLDLNGTGVTDKGLLGLKKAKALETLGAIAPGTSEQGIEQLETAIGHTLRRISPLPVVNKKPAFEERVSEKGVHSVDLHFGHK